MPTVVVRFEPNKKNPERVQFITVSTKGTTGVWSFLPVFTCQLLPGMKQQGQSGMIILSPVVSVSKLRRIFGF